MTYARAPKDDDAWIAALVERHQPGFGLEQAFYIDGRVFERDLERFFYSHWFFAGHASRVVEPGDYFVFPLGKSSFVVVRGADGKIRAFANVCRHRGSLLCTKEHGRATRLLCPFHAWSYDTTGRLRSAPNMSEGFDRSGHGLRRIHAREVFGFVYVSLAEHPPDLEPGIQAIRSFVEPHGFDQARIAARREVVLQANWKLAMENFLECYHCPAAHPEYCTVNPRSHLIGLPNLHPDVASEMLTWIQQAAALGHRVGGVAHDGGRHEESCAVNRDPLGAGFLTSSQNGQPVAPVMGALNGCDGGQTQWSIGPVSYGIADCDHAVLFRFLPLAPDRTSVSLTWLVHEDAVEGVDYEVDQVTWMWAATFPQDEILINETQRGVRSDRYRAGPYALTESVTLDWLERYLAEIR